jgi:hypothetical protein
MTSVLRRRKEEVGSRACPRVEEPLPVPAGQSQAAASTAPARRPRRMMRWRTADMLCI